MTTPINNFQDILDAMERDPALRDALRRHILTEELLQVPARLERIENDLASVKDDLASVKDDVAIIRTDLDALTEQVAQIGGRVSMLTGEDYESHVAIYVPRELRRNLGIHVSVFFTQRDRAALTQLLDNAESEGRIEPVETNELDRADIVLTADGPTDYILAEVSLTIQQDDINRAAERARLLAKATARTVTPFAIGAREEPDLHRGHVQVLLIPERQPAYPSR